MADLEGSDILGQSVFDRLKQFQNELSKTEEQLKRLLQTGKQSEANILVAKSINQVSQETKKLTDSAKELETLQKNIAASSKQRYSQETQSLEQLIQKREQLKQKIKEQIVDQKQDQQLLKDGIISRELFNKRINDSNTRITTLKQGILQLNRETKQQVILTTNVGGAYQKLTTALEKARTDYKNLAASGTATTQALRSQQKVVEDLNKKVTAIDNSVGQFQRNVGNYSGTFRAAATSVRSLLSAFGIVTGLLLFAKVLKDIVSLTAEYEYQNSRLRAVLGASAVQVRELREQQQELGRATHFTAVEVSKMQVELAKLGFPIADIKEMTSSTLSAALALGSDLAEQAALTGATLRAFGLEAKETARVNDVLAKATASSGLDFQKLATAMPYVAANAKALGITLEGTTALMGRLANAGFQASTIGTTLRNIFLKLADSSSNLSQRLKEPVKDTPSLLRGLKQLQEEGIDLSEAFDLTDQRAVSAFLTLVSGADDVKELEEQLKRAKGAADEMARVMGDNLRGDIKLLTSAWQGLVLAITSGDSAFSTFLRTVTRGLTSFISWITPTKDLTREIISEKEALNNLVETLLKSNEESDIWKKGIDELNSKYPAFLKNLSDEEISHETIALRLKDVNDQLKRKLELVSAQKALIPIQDRLTQLAIDEFQLTKQKTKAEEDKAIAEKKGLKGKYDLINATKTLESIDIQMNKIGIERNAIQDEYDDLLQAVLKAQKEIIGDDYTGQQIKLADIILPGVVSKTKEILEAELKLAQFRKEQAIKDFGKGINAQDVQKRIDLEIKLEEFKRDRLLKINEQSIKDAKLKEREKGNLTIAGIQETILKNKELLDEQVKAGKITQEQANAEIEKQKQKLVEAEKRIQQNITNAARLGEIERQQIIEESTAVIKEIRDKGEDEVIKLEIKAIQKAGAIRLTEQQKIIDDEIKRIQDAAIKGTISREQAEKQIAKVKRATADEIVKIEIETVEKILALANISTEERAALEIKLTQLKKDLNDAYFNQLQDREQTSLEKTAEYFEKAHEIYVAFTQSITQLFDNFTERRIQNIDREIAKLEEQTDREIELAGDNDRAKKDIEAQAEARRKKLERERLQEERRAAIRNKVIALFEAGIRTALAVLNQLAHGDPYTAFARAALAGALGAVQIAAIASKPIPQFEEGGITKDSVIIAGEAGSELYKTPTGRFGITPDTATVMKLPVGTEIFPHEETMKILAMNAFNNNMTDSVRADYVMYKKMDSLEKAIIDSNKSLERAIIESAPGDLLRQGSLLYEAKKKVDGSKKLIRLKSMGY